MPFPSNYGQSSYGSAPSTNSPYVLAAETSLSRSVRPGNEVTAIGFDNSHELLWTANATGRISGYMAASGMKQVSSFNVVRNVITSFEVYDELIIATTCDAVFGFRRNGQLLFKSTSPVYHDLRTVCRPSPRRNQIVLGGRQKDLIIFDIETQKVINSQSDTEGAPACMIKANHTNIITCNERGIVQIRSLNGERVQEVQAHLGPITGFDVRENLFVTAGSTIKTGYYNNPYGTPRADPFLKLYDIRFAGNPQMQPISTPFPPQYVFFTGNYCPGGILMTSHFGDMWALNLNSPNQSRSIATHSTYSAISHAAVSSTHQVFGTVDVNQNAFLYATYSENLRSYGCVNYYSSPYPQYDDYSVEYWDPNQT